MTAVSEIKADQQLIINHLQHWINEAEACFDQEAVESYMSLQNLIRRGYIEGAYSDHQDDLHFMITPLGEEEGQDILPSFISSEAELEWEYIDPKDDLEEE